MKYIALLFMFAVYTKAVTNKCDRMINSYKFIVDAINDIEVEFKSDKYQSRNRRLRQRGQTPNSAPGSIAELLIQNSSEYPNSSFMAQGKIKYSDIKKIYEAIEKGEAPDWIPSGETGAVSNLMLELHNEIIASQEMKGLTAAQYELILRMKREDDCSFLNTEVEKLPNITIATPEDATCIYEDNSIFNEAQDTFVFDNMQAIFELNRKVARDETVKQAEKRLAIITNQVCSNPKYQVLKDKKNKSDNSQEEAKARGFDDLCLTQTRIQENVEKFDEYIDAEFGDNYTFGTYMKQQGIGQVLTWGLGTGINYWQTGFQIDQAEQYDQFRWEQRKTYANFLYTNCINPNLWNDIDLTIIETTDGLPLRSDQSNRDWRATGGFPNCNPDAVINPAFSTQLPVSNIMPWSSLNAQP